MNSNMRIIAASHHPTSPAGELQPVQGGRQSIEPESFRVDVIRSAKRIKTVSARIVEGVIRVRVPAWMSSEEQDRAVEQIVGRIEKRMLCTHIALESRAHELAARFDLPEPRSIEWSHRQRIRLGSCTVGSGDIRISSRLTKVPPWVLDHVIVHELAHLVEPNHSPAFHALVNRNPEAERAEGYLLAFNTVIPQQPGRSPRAASICEGVADDCAGQTPQPDDPQGGSAAGPAYTCTGGAT